jgi:hypothetical protein
MKTLLAQSNIIIVAVALTQLAGCAPLTPNLDGAFGRSVESLRVYQTINPTAANTANPGLDGPAAKEVIERYYKSYSAPTPHQNVFTIGVGGGTGSVAR